METQVILIEALIERAEKLSKISYELAKLKTVETTTQVVTSFISRLFVIIMIILFVLVLTIGVALLIGELMGKLYYGFFIVAAFYLITGIVLHFFLRTWIKKPVSNIMISQMLR